MEKTTNETTKNQEKKLLKKDLIDKILKNIEYIGEQEFLINKSINENIISKSKEDDKEYVAYYYLHLENKNILNFKFIINYNKIFLNDDNKELSKYKYIDTFYNMFIEPVMFNQTIEKGVLNGLDILCFYYEINKKPVFMKNNLLFILKQINKKELNEIYNKLNRLVIL